MLNIKISVRELCIGMVRKHVWNVSIFQVQSINYPNIVYPQIILLLIDIYTDMCFYLQVI